MLNCCECLKKPQSAKLCIEKCYNPCLIHSVQKEMGCQTERLITTIRKKGDCCKCPAKKPEDFWEPASPECFRYHHKFTALRKKWSDEICSSINKNPIQQALCRCSSSVPKKRSSSNIAQEADVICSSNSKNKSKPILTSPISASTDVDKATQTTNCSCIFEKETALALAEQQSNIFITPLHPQKVPPNEVHYSKSHQSPSKWNQSSQIYTYDQNKIQESQLQQKLSQPQYNSKESSSVYREKPKNINQQESFSQVPHIQPGSYEDENNFENLNQREIHYTQRSFSTPLDHSVSPKRSLYNNKSSAYLQKDRSLVNHVNSDKIVDQSEFNKSHCLKQDCSCCCKLTDPIQSPYTEPGPYRSESPTHLQKHETLTDQSLSSHRYISDHKPFVPPSSQLHRSERSYPSHSKHFDQQKIHPDHVPYTEPKDRHHSKHEQDTDMDERFAHSQKDRSHLSYRSEQPVSSQLQHLKYSHPSTTTENLDQQKIHPDHVPYTEPKDRHRSKHISDHEPVFEQHSSKRSYIASSKNLDEQDSDMDERFAHSQKDRSHLSYRSKQPVSSQLQHLKYSQPSTITENLDQQKLPSKQLPHTERSHTIKENLIKFEKGKGSINYTHGQSQYNTPVDYEDYSQLKQSQLKTHLDSTDLDQDHLSRDSLLTQSDFEDKQLSLREPSQKRQLPSKHLSQQQHFDKLSPKEISANQLQHSKEKPHYYPENEEKRLPSGQLPYTEHSRLTKESLVHSQRGKTHSNYQSNQNQYEISTSKLPTSQLNHSKIKQYHSPEIVEARLPSDQLMYAEHNGLINESSIYSKRGKSKSHPIYESNQNQFQPSVNKLHSNELNHSKQKQQNFSEDLEEERLTYCENNRNQCHIPADKFPICRLNQTKQKHYSEDLDEENIPSEHVSSNESFENLQEDKSQLNHSKQKHHYSDEDLEEERFSSDQLPHMEPNYLKDKSLTHSQRDQSHSNDKSNQKQLHISNNKLINSQLKHSKPKQYHYSGNLEEQLSSDKLNHSKSKQYHYSENLEEDLSSAQLNHSKLKQYHYSENLEEKLSADQIPYAKRSHEKISSNPLHHSELNNVTNENLVHSQRDSRQNYETNQNQLQVSSKKLPTNQLNQSKQKQNHYPKDLSKKKNLSDSQRYTEPDYAKNKNNSNLQRGKSH